MPITIPHDEIDDWRKRVTGSGKEIRDYRKYASGKQLKLLSPEQKRILGNARYHLAVDNILDLVLRTAAGRLTFEGWTIGDPATFTPTSDTPDERSDDAIAVENFLAQFYLKSRLSSKQFDTHYAALRDGVTALSLAWKPGEAADDPGRPIAFREPWWDGERGMFVAFDDDGEPAWAVREWIDVIGKREVWRRTVYYPDQITRYRKEGGGWVPFELPTDPPGTRGTVPWVRANGQPLGLPVIPFSNSVADTAPYGRSDIAGLLGIQDDINQIGLDLTAAAMFTGFQMYWASGVKIDDPNAVGPGQMLSADNPASRFGTLSPGPMDSLIAAYDSKRQTIAIDTSTPMHIIGGQWPSGEALLRAEMPLVDKVTRLGAVCAPSWILLAHRATELANTFGGQSLNEDAPITVDYAAPERLDEMSQVTVQKATVDLYAALANISDPQLMVKTGLVTATEAQEIVDGRAERANALIDTAAEF